MSYSDEVLADAPSAYWRMESHSTPANSGRATAAVVGKGAEDWVWQWNLTGWPTDPIRSFPAAWFAITPEVTGTYVIEEQGWSDTYAVLYEGTTQLATSDDEGPGNGFGFTRSLTGGVTYYLAATFWAIGTGDMAVRVSGGPTVGANTDHGVTDLVRHLPARMLPGTPALGAGKVGNGLVLDGAVLHGLDAGRGNVVSLGVPMPTMSVEGWVKTASSAVCVLVGADADSGGGFRNYTLRLESGQAVFRMAAALTVTAASTGLTLGDDQWHHLVGTYDGNVARVYADGALVGTSPATSGPVTAVGNNRLYIGVKESGTTSFVGAVDEVAVYPTALSQARVEAHYGAADPVPGPLPVEGSAALPRARTLTASATLTGTFGTSSTMTRARTSTAAPQTVVGGTVVSALMARTRTLTQGDLPLDVAGGTHLGRLRSLSGIPLVLPAPAATFPADALWRTVVVTVPDPVAVAGRNGRPDPAQFTVTDVARSVYGRPQLVMDGQDVTVTRGVPVRIEQYSRSMPFGDEGMVLQFPQYTAIEPRPSWTAPGSVVRLYLLDADGVRRPDPLWEGYVVSSTAAAGDGASAGIQVECAGLLRYAAQSLRQPPFTAPGQDVGQAVKSAMDGVVSRPYGVMPLTLTGVQTLNKGARSDTVAGYVTDLLSQSVGADGYGWTVLMRPGGTPYLHRLSDTGPEDLTVTIGQPGLVLDNVGADPLMSPNVIYGVATDPTSGCVFTNLVWSGQAASNPPRYPFDNPAKTISVGGYDTDAETDTGSGVSTWERKMLESGYIGAVNGTYSSSDRDACRRFQRDAGIQVDGVIGPQTWSATWAYARVSDLTKVFYRPFAYDPAVEPYLYAADGQVLGPNPGYDPSVLRVERFVNFGTATKEEALAAAEAMLAQGALPDVTGRLTLGTDPPQMNRREIRAGQKVRLRGWGGAAAGVIATVVQVTIDSEGGASLTIDTRARDLVVATAIAERDRSNASPAWRTSTSTRRSSQDIDTKIGYDCSSAQGKVENLQVYAGLWSVVRIPLVDRGRAAAVKFACGVGLRPDEWELLGNVPSGKKFALGLFAKPVTAAALASVVGNPLAGGDRWTEEYQPLVERYGVLAAWGTGDDGAGFSPGQEADGDTVTGRLLDTGSWEFAGDPAFVPYIFVAAYSESSAFISGRVYLAPDV